MKDLIVVFSYSHGNTIHIAKMIQKKTWADLKVIETIQPYSDDYDEVVDLGLKEVKKGYEPPIKEISIEGYDRIFLGTPTWWYTMAPAMKTFIHMHDFKGKTVIPFMTHGGWSGKVIKDMKKELKDSIIPTSIEVQFDSNGGDTLITSLDTIEEWIKQL